MVVTFAFCIPPFVLKPGYTPAYIFHYIDVFYNTTQNKAGASVMAALITLMCLCSTMSAVATASRQMFAFARDKGLPFSSFLCRVRTFSKCPQLQCHRSNRANPGPSRMGHSAQRCSGLLRNHMPSIPHQSWLIRCLQRHPLSHDRRDHQLVHHFHLPCRPPENPPRPPAPTCSLESGKSWSTDQHLGRRLPGPHLRLHLLPDRKSSYTVCYTFSAFLALFTD